MAAELAPETLILPHSRRSGLVLPSGAHAPATGRDATFLKDIGLWLPETPDKFPVLRSQLRSLPIEQFLAYVSRITFFRLNPSSRFFTEMRNAGWDPRLDLRDYQLGFLVRVLLDEYDRTGERFWPSPDPGAHIALIRELANLATHVWPAADEHAAETEEILAMLVRIAHQQFHDFEDFERSLGRALLLYGECSMESEQQHGISLDAVLRESVGLGLDDAWFLPFTLFALLIEGRRPQVFSFEQLAKSRDFPGLTVERITKLLDWLGRDYAGLRAASKAKSVSAQTGFEPYNLNPLVEFPIVRLPDGQSVVPVARYLYRRVTTGLFYDLIRSKAPHVANVIGRAIELYVRRLVEDLPSRGVIVGETAYGKQKVTSEWMIVEKNAVVIIECKRASLLQKAKTTGSVTDLQNDLARPHGVADGINQMLLTRGAILRGEVSGVPSDRPIVGLLLTMDTFFLANTDYVRQIIARVLTTKGVDLGDFRYQLGSIADLDAVCSLLTTTRETLSTMLLRKMVTAASTEIDLQQWANSQPPSEKRMRLPSHRRAEDEAMIRWTEAYGTSRLVRRLRSSKRRPR